ncbi:MAG TPA: hypothetical protein VKR61_22330 [Bryobacteraceae bacterium]|nr:hypothetical protein [Bryobacteraceae bacterium]
MDSDRKYRQPGYMDSDRPDFKERRGEDGRPRVPGPKPPLDITGPRLPRLVQAVTAARCFNCSTQLTNGVDWSGVCPKCGTALHCCKQCSHFESSTRFQCLKPIPVRIPVKDKANDCTLFLPRVTVARDGSAAAPPPAVPRVETPTSPDAARSAFDKLFKK